MNIKWILWPTDGSDESNDALKVALYFARTLGAGLVCMHVAQTGLAIADLQPSYEDVIGEILKQTEERFKTRFERVKQENPDLRVSYIISRGAVAESIADLTRSDRDGIVVMGKRGRGLIGSMLLGSNTLKVLRNSSVPVLSVKAGEHKKEYDIKKILVPLDTGDTADSSLRYALWLAGKTGASVTVLYVLWIDVNICEITPELVAELKLRSSKILGDRVDRIRSEYSETCGGEAIANIETRLESGVSPALKITGYARDNDFDLIVLNTHGRKGIERLMLGSEAENIIREAPCPVLAIKP